MNTNECADLRIDGSGSSGGGTYNSVKINGSGKISGDIICSEFKINGAGEAVGNVEAGRFVINGSGHIVGNLKAEEAKISGSASLGGNVTGGTIKISGSADIKSGVDMHQIKIEGTMKAGGDCSAESFYSNGVFEIGGLLNADDIDIQLYWHKSRAREIGGGRINVRPGAGGGSILRSLFSFGLSNPQLEADTIEGDEISLENTKAKVVRGNNITIGPGCDIGLVEYKGQYQRNGDARVGSEQKV